MVNTENKVSYTFCDDTVSDLHKDAFGFRPSEGFWGFWETATDDEKQEEWNALERAATRRFKEEKDMEALAIQVFERRIEGVIACGAKDRKTALRWLMEGSEANGDWDYLCYLEGIPYGYCKEMQ